MTRPDQDITRLLKNLQDGSGGAMDELMRSVYDDLRRVAERHMTERFGRGLPGVTLEPSALVNESFLKIIKQRNDYDNRGQFFAIATRVMLRVLVDYQRARSAAKARSTARSLGSSSSGTSTFSRAVSVGTS